MTNLSDEDVERIAAALAPKLVNQVQEKHHEFWIDAEQHYQDHYEWQKARKVWTKAGWIFFSAFLGLVVVGSFVLMAVGLLTSGDVKMLMRMIVTKNP